MGYLGMLRMPRRGRAPLDRAAVRRSRLKITLAVVSVIAMGGSFYAFQETSKADVINTTDFVITVKTDNPGYTNSSSFTLPTWYMYAYNYNVDWNNDGVADETGLTGDVTHDFGTPGTYVIRISGTFPAAHFSVSNDIWKLISVDQWGTGQWQSFKDAFSGCMSTTIAASDIPNLSQVTDASNAFSGVAQYTGSGLNSWDVSAITNMSGMFRGISTFNQALDSWNTSNVTNMSNMFGEDTVFNQPLSSWNTSNVTNMSYMFGNATAFNQNINSWNISSVTDLSAMFYRASSFNQPLSSWNTSNVTNMSNMFGNATAFNQNINSWNTSNVTTMNSMFYSANSFNQPLNGWDVSKVQNMGSMFTAANNFNQPLNTWNTSSVKDMSYMFGVTNSFNQPLGSWDTSSVTTMSGMLNRAQAFDQDLGGWNTSNVTDMSYMFYQNYTFNNGGSPSIGQWDTHSLKTTRYMFWNAYSFNQSLAGWDVTAFEPYTSYNSAESMFQAATSFSTQNYDATIESWASQNVMYGVKVGGTNGENNNYCDSVLARASLINDHGWIFDNDKICPATITTSAISEVVPMTGTGAPGATVSLTVSATRYTAVVDGSGNWSIPAPVSSWPTGTVSITAQLSDEPLFGSPIPTVDRSNGNYSLSVSVGSNVVVAPIAQPIIDIPPSGLITNDSKPTVAGTGEPSATIEVKDDTNTSLCSTTVDTNGLWSCAPSVSLADGGRMITATQTYTGTSASHTSAGVNITVDTVAPTAPIITSPALYELTPDPTPDVRGTGEPSAQLTVKNDIGEIICSATVAGDGSWVCTSNLVLDDGSHAIVAVQFDVAGNESAESDTILFAVGPITSTFDFSTIVPPSGIHASVSQATLSVTSSACYTIDKHELISGTGVIAPQSNVSIVGGVRYDLSCVVSSGSAQATVTLGEYYSNLAKLHIYKKTASLIEDITDQVNLRNTTDVNGKAVTVLSYTLTDGSSYDEDELANGMIVDPLYVGVARDPVLANTGWDIWLSILLGGLLTSFGAVAVARYKED